MTEEVDLADEFGAEQKTKDKKNKKKKGSKQKKTADKYQTVDLEVDITEEQIKAEEVVHEQ